MAGGWTPTNYEAKLREKEIQCKGHLTFFCVLSIWTVFFYWENHSLYKAKKIKNKKPTSAQHTYMSWKRQMPHRSCVYSVTLSWPHLKTAVPLTPFPAFSPKYGPSFGKRYIWLFIWSLYFPPLKWKCRAFCLVSQHLEGCRACAQWKHVECKDVPPQPPLQMRHGHVPKALSTWNIHQGGRLKATCTGKNRDSVRASDRGQWLSCQSLAPTVFTASPVAESGVRFWLIRWWRICLQCRRLRFVPWVGKIPWKRKGQLTAVFLPREFHGQRRLVGYGPWGPKEWDTMGD